MRAPMGLGDFRALLVDGAQRRRREMVRSRRFGERLSELPDTDRRIGTCGEFPQSRGGAEL